MNEYNKQEYAKVLNQQIKDYLLSHTCALAGVNDDIPELLGSSFFIEINNTIILTTAMHVIKMLKNFKKAVILSKNNTISIINPDSFITKESPYDLAIMKLTTEQKKEYIQEKHIYTLSNLFIDYKENKKYELLTAGGFCIEFSKFEEKAKALPCSLLVFSNITASSQEEIPYAYSDSNIHILIKCPKKGNKAGSYDLPELPPLNGLSGCAIIDTSMTKSLKEIWSTEDIKLIGVLTDYESETEFIVGTHIKHLISFIYETYPELSPIK